MGASKRAMKRTVVAAYAVIWTVSVAVFWCFTGGADAMGYAIVFLWGVLSLAELSLSFLIGLGTYWPRAKWLCIPAFGIMHMLAEYVTFSMANMLAFGKLNAPQIELLALGMAFSTIGLLCGMAVRFMREKVRGRRP